MRGNRNALAGVVSLVVAVLLAGCPSPKTFEIWLINGSGNFSVTSVKIADTEKEKTTQELITDEGVPVSKIRLVKGLDVTPFEGKSLTVTVTGHASGFTVNPEVSVVVTTPIQSGAVVPILVTDALLSIGVHYVPLESSSAAKSLLERISETVEF